MNITDFLSTVILLMLFFIARQEWEDSAWRKHEVMKWKNIRMGRILRRARFLLMGDAPSVIIKKENRLIAKAERRLFWLQFMAGRKDKK